MVTIRSVLCATDFSAPARAAVLHAAGVAHRFGAELVLVHVISPAAYPTSQAASIHRHPGLRDEIQRRLDRAVAEARAEVGLELSIRTSIRQGVPHEEILAAANEEGCDWIVIATRGHTGLSHLLLGSTAGRVVRLSPIPVLTVRSAN